MKEIGIALLIITVLLAFFAFSDKVGEDDHPPGDDDDT